jgi:serine protease Do
VIAEVKPGSVAEQAGLQSGDVIVGVGDSPVATPSEATRAIRESLKNSQAVALRIVRDGQQVFVAVQPGGQEQASGGSTDDDN